MKNYLRDIDMKNWFIIITFFILIISNYANFDPTEIILLLSKIFITLPLILLGIFAVPKIRSDIKQTYWMGRESTFAQIRSLRKEQDKLEEKDDIEGLIRLDNKIISLREDMRVFKHNRFEKCIILSLVLFIITIVLTFFDAGSYIDMPNIIFIVIFFMSGLYYVLQMIQSIIYSFEMDEIWGHH